MAKVGAPPRYKSVEEMQKKIDEYFEWCEGTQLFTEDGKPFLDRNGKPVFVNVHPPTITGLALGLGFTTRMSLLNYEGKPEFVDTIKQAKSRVERYAEERLFDRDGQRGSEFSLKNNFKGWDSDKRQNEVTGSVVILNDIPKPD